jgi:pimeloyl-ACP methyl ester carboxylesterase
MPGNGGSSSNATVVLVHGNPESPAIWDPLLRELDRDTVVRLSPPGFGASVPPGFAGTFDAHHGWLVAELERIGEPVDLVGHDLGGAMAVRLAMTRPDLIRTWVSDILGGYDPDYVWHDNALKWQTPGVGEEAVARFTGGAPQAMAARLGRAGIPEKIASRVAEAQVPEHGASILNFYRSAAQPAMAELGRDIAAASARPGLSIIATEDPYVGTLEMRRRTADRAGAESVILKGLGHWWMIQDPSRGADALRHFWHARP